MQGIEQVKGVFQYGMLDKAPPAVVHMDGDKSCHGIKTAGKQRITRDRLDDGMPSQHIKNKDHYHTGGAVIGIQHSGNAQHRHHQDDLQKIAQIASVNVDGQRTQKQGEEYILMLRAEEIAADHQVKGDFGDDSEHQKPQQIFDLIACVAQALTDEEAIDGEGQPADLAQDEINGYGFAQSGKQRLPENGKCVKYITGVVDQHCDDGDQLQHAAAKDAVLLERLWHSVPSQLWILCGIYNTF